MKVTLIKNLEIKELREKVKGTEVEELVHKLHYSYNALKIYVKDLKSRNEELIKNEKENEMLKNKILKNKYIIAMQKSELERYKRMINKEEE